MCRNHGGSEGWSLPLFISGIYYCITIPFTRCIISITKSTLGYGNTYNIDICHGNKRIYIICVLTCRAWKRSLDGWI